MRRVTGVGGIFFKARDPAALGNWYKTHLGRVANLEALIQAFKIELWEPPA